jgi:hypothetical protein
VTIAKVSGPFFAGAAQVGEAWIVVKTAAGNRTILKRAVLDILEPGQTGKPAPDK